jgi:hypothetical protein
VRLRYIAIGAVAISPPSQTNAPLPAATPFEQKVMTVPLAQHRPSPLQALPSQAQAQACVAKFLTRHWSVQAPPIAFLLSQAIRLWYARVTSELRRWHNCVDRPCSVVLLIRNHSILYASYGEYDVMDCRHFLTLIHSLAAEIRSCLS